MFIDQLSAPFGFLKKAVNSAEQNYAAKEGQEIKEENEGDLGSIAIHQFELNLQRQLDEKANIIAKQYQLTEVPWAELTKAALLVYFGLTMLSMIARPDFLSLVVITLGMFAMECPSYITRRTFRMLVGLALLTFVYDLVFLIFVRNVEAEDMEF